MEKGGPSGGLNESASGDKWHEALRKRASTKKRMRKAGKQEGEGDRMRDPEIQDQRGYDDDPETPRPDRAILLERPSSHTDASDRAAKIALEAKRAIAS
jgi:hypothetical protein